MSGRILILIFIISAFPLPAISQIPIENGQALIVSASDDSFDIIVESVLSEETLAYYLIKYDSSGEFIASNLIFETQVASNPIEMFRYSDQSLLVLFSEKEETNNSDIARLVRITMDGTVTWNVILNISTGVTMDFITIQENQPRLVVYEPGFLEIYTISDLGTVEKEITLDIQAIESYHTTIFLNDQYVSFGNVENTSILIEQRFFDPLSGSEVSSNVLPLEDVTLKSITPIPNGFILMGKNLETNITTIYIDPGQISDVDILTIPEDEFFRGASLAISTDDGAVLWGNIFNTFYEFYYLSLDHNYHLTYGVGPGPGAVEVRLFDGIPAFGGALFVGAIQLPESGDFVPHVVKLTSTGGLDWHEFLFLDVVSTKTDRTRIPIPFLPVILTFAILTKNRHIIAKKLWFSLD